MKVFLKETSFKWGGTHIHLYFTTFCTFHYVATFIMLLRLKRGMFTFFWNTRNILSHLLYDTFNWICSSIVFEPKIWFYYFETTHISLFVSLIQNKFTYFIGILMKWHGCAIIFFIPVKTRYENRFSLYTPIHLSYDWSIYRLFGVHTNSSISVE